VLICSERRLLEHSNWLTRQIFKGKINIREDKLLLFHCLLELGLPKVNVSEQYQVLISFVAYMCVPDPEWALTSVRNQHCYSQCSGSRINFFRIQDELSFWLWNKLVFRFQTFFCRIRDPGWKNVRIRIRGRKMFRSGIQHPGSATLVAFKDWM
jgi:hypothetical protein